MCLTCPGSGLADTPENRAVVHANIRESLEIVDEYINGAHHVEDVYRKATVYYHGTLMAARQQDVDPPLYPLDRLAQCKALFELTNASEYEAIFKPFHETIDALVNLRSRHFRSSGTVSELCHRLHVDINPRSSELTHKAKQFFVGMQESLKYAMDLEITSKRRFGGINQGAWFRPIDPFTQPHKLMTTGPEWVQYRDWLLCLPETPRAIAAGHSLLDLASQLMYIEEDGISLNDRYGTNGADDNDPMDDMRLRIE